MTRPEQEGQAGKKTLEQVVAALTGRRLARMRVAAKQTQAELADAARVKRATLAAIERGIQGTSPGQLMRFARALGVDDYRLIYPPDADVALSDVADSLEEETVQSFETRVFALLSRIVGADGQLERRKRYPHLVELHDFIGITGNRNVFAIMGGAQPLSASDLRAAYDQSKKVVPRSQLTVILRCPLPQDAADLAHKMDIHVLDAADLGAIAMQRERTKAPRPT